MKKLMSVIAAAVCAFFSVQAAEYQLGKLYCSYMTSQEFCINVPMDGVAFESESVAIPVTGVSEDAPLTVDMIDIQLGTLKGYKNLEVMTDKEMVEKYFDGRNMWNTQQAEEYEVEDLGDRWGFETSRGFEYEIDKDLWGESDIVAHKVTAVEDRAWILFEGDVNKKEAGALKSFTISIKGEGDAVLAGPTTYAAHQPFSRFNVGSLKPTDFCNRVTFSDYKTSYDFFLLPFGTSEATADNFVLLQPAKGKKDVFVNVPSAGTLVIQRVNYDSLDKVVRGTDEVKTNLEGKCKISLSDLFDSSWGTCIFTQMAFYPVDTNYVAVTAKQASYNAKYGKAELRGYVKGSGTYKAGDTVKLTAVTMNSDFEFNNWEVLGGAELPEDTDLTKNVLTFKVTDDMCGTAEDAKQIKVRAVWRDTPQVSVAIDDEKTGSVKGEGVYASGKKVTLKATPAKGYVFSKWYTNSLENAETELTVSQAPSYTFVMPTTSVDLKAKFVSTEADTATIALKNEEGKPYEFAANCEYAPNTELAPISVTFESTSLSTLAVKGLPAGLKFTAKDIYKKGSKTDIEYAANTIYGTFTKSGVYTTTISVTTASKKTISEDIVFTVIDRAEGSKDAGKYVVKAESADATMGKTTGSGLYAFGKTVTLKATANKGYVFSGWYSVADGTPTEQPEARTPSYVVTMASNDVAYVAKFIETESDAAVLNTIDVAAEYKVKEEIEPITVTVKSTTSLPTITVKGLPAGLKFTTKEAKVSTNTIPANTIYGTPTKSGIYAATVIVTTAGKQTTSETVNFVVRGQDEYVLKATTADAAEGKVTGAGSYAEGKKVTLKATANKGYVFSGWYKTGIENELVTRTPSYAVTMPEGDVDVKAKFIALADDKISLISIDTVEEEYAPKQAINSIAVNIESTSLPTITVKGLPAGLKFTTKEVKVGAETIPANTIYGTPTKSGVYTTTISAATASKKTMTKSVTFIVKAEGEKVLQIVAQQVDESDNALGKVTGTGVYADGKKATLKATANKGYVFAGWYTDSSFCCPLVSEEVDYRTPSLSYTVSTNESAVNTLYARFVTKEEDKASSVTITNLDQYHEMNSDTELPALVLESYSLPKVTVSGLPAGLKFDAKTRTFSGTPTKPGKYTVKFNLSNTSTKTTIETNIYVENLKGADALLTITDSEGADISGDWNGHFYSISVGVSQPWHYRLGQDDSFTYPTTKDVLKYGLPVLKVRNDGDKVALSGLPAGLKYNAEKGTIEGVATKAGYYTVYVTVKSGKVSSISTFVIHVYELPTWAVGTFVGSCDYVVNTTNGQERGMFRLEVTVAANGKITGKAVYPYVDANKRSFKTTTFSESSFELGNSVNCFYVETSADFKRGTKTLTHTFNLSIEPDTYKEGEEASESIGIMSVNCCNVETDGSLELFGYDLVQNAWKIKSLTKPEFANNAKTVGAEWEGSVPNATDEAIITNVDLTIKPNGSVAAVVKGEDAEGTAFKPRKLTSELIIWGFGAEDYPDCWYATTLLNSNGYVMGVDLVLPVNDEGKVKVDECEVVDVYFVNEDNEGED